VDLANVAAVSNCREIVKMDMVQIEHFHLYKFYAANQFAATSAKSACADWIERRLD